MLFRLTKISLTIVVGIIIYITFFGTYKKYFLSQTIGNLDKKIIALTFDDGPVDTTGDLLDSLKEARVKATFFVIGEEVSKRPDMLQRMAYEGHTIGNHTWDHPHALGLRRKKFIENQIDKANVVITATIGKEVHYVRTPFGESTPYSDFIIRQHGMTPIHWTLSFKDWQHSFTAEELRKKLSQIDRSEVLLLHDRAYNTPDKRKALVQGIQELKQRGYEFVTLDQVGL